MVHAGSAALVGAVVNLNTPGTYLHWSVLVISVANLGVIGAMLLIFAGALLVRFPPGRQVEQVGDPEGPERAGRSGGDSAPSWTGRLRRLGVRLLPPDKLLPETQPSYVASWIYVFGVASLAALAVAIVSGLLIALGGVDWWHSNPGGHFFNSLHLWSVELFMAFMVIHLWGKFWMAAWRGQRGRTWMTGVLAFLASVVECFTGYLSQQNFDSQWIATNGKDAFNAAGVGGFWNVMNLGQMLLWHVVLMPLVLVGLVAVHILLVRYRGVVHPFPARAGRDALGQRSAEVRRPTRRELRAHDAASWRGPVRRYDLVKEAVAATVVVVLAAVALASLLSSPDKPQITLRQWASADPADFVATAASELAGTSFSATYGPPYNNGDGAVQGLGISWQRLAGILDPIDPQQMFVLDPLRAVAGHDRALRRALAAWGAASPAQQRSWAQAYATAAARRVTFATGGAPVVAPGSYGPVPELMAAELTLARDGGLDASLLARQPFYGTNFTKPLLCLADGSYYANQATAEHLQGNQWGVMNETGSYPGQPWLWLYQLWYHIPGIDTSANIDLIAIYLTGAATLLLLLVPFIPGLRDLPRLVPIHRLVWRHYYREAESLGERRPS
ncbi:MAG TPA: cytochrome b N-terminal domain-containing protein [Acidimicrobiales bacterium]|nr:cytochrome b N-terminal domain-containing protein [Acidimicrobiales bacterium]